MYYYRVPRWILAFSCLLWPPVEIPGIRLLALAQQTEKTERTQDQVEEIYIARSVRESRVAPTDFCAEAKTGFKSNNEDRYTFRSTATRPADGRMIDANLKKIGSGHACFGQTPNPATRNFYLELLLGYTLLRGIGQCLTAKPDFPERGLTVNRCFLDLSDPRGHYVGGQLTTNTMSSLRLLGADSDPPGYAQPSIATISSLEEADGALTA